MTFSPRDPSYISQESEPDLHPLLAPTVFSDSPSPPELTLPDNVASCENSKPAPPLFLPFSPLHSFHTQHVFFFPSSLATSPAHFLSKVPSLLHICLSWTYSPCSPVFPPLERSSLHPLHLTLLFLKGLNF